MKLVNYRQAATAEAGIVFDDQIYGASGAMSQPDLLVSGIYSLLLSHQQ
jgi:hypothetical protein